jgi:WD40 repeat protein
MPQGTSLACAGVSGDRRTEQGSNATNLRNRSAEIGCRGVLSLCVYLALVACASVRAPDLNEWRTDTLPNQPKTKTGCTDGFGIDQRPMRDLQAGNQSLVTRVLQTGNSAQLSAMSHAGDGLFLVTGATDGSVVVWDSQSGVQIRLFYATSSVRAIAAIPGTTIVLLATSDCRVSGWDIRTGRSLWSADGVGERIEEIALVSHHSDETVFAVSAIGEVVVVTVTGKTAQVALRYPVDRAEGIAASPDGKRLAIASHADVVDVVDFGTRTRLRAPLRTGKFRSNTMFVAEDVLRVVEGTGQVVDLNLRTKDRRPVCSITDGPSYLRDHENVRPSGLWRLARAGAASLAVTYEWSENPRLIVWDIQSCRGTGEIPAGKARYQLGRPSLVMPSWAGDALLYGEGRDVKLRPLVGMSSATAFSGSVQPIDHVRVSPTRSSVVLESTTRVAVLDWERQTLNVAPIARTLVQSLPTDISALTNATSAVTRNGVDHLVAIRSSYEPRSGSKPDATRIEITMSPVGGGGKKVCSVRERGEYSFHLATAEGLILIAQVATASPNSWTSSLTVLDPWTCTVARRIDDATNLLLVGGYLDEGNAVAMSPDGTLLASGSAGRWNPQIAHLASVGGGPCAPVKTSELTAALRPEPPGATGEPLRGVRSVALSPDGQYLIAGHENGDANVWDLVQLKATCASKGPVPALWTIEGNDWGARAVAIDRTSGLAGVGDESGLLRLFKLTARGPELSARVRFESPVRSIQFMNTQQALVVTADGAATLIDQRSAAAPIAAVTESDALDFEVARFAAMADDSWVTTTKDGRFDTSAIESLAGLRWVVADEPLRPLPLEIFTREYFEPGLLPRKKACTDEVLASPSSRACDKEFASLRNLAALNRLQPAIERIEVLPEQGTATDKDNPTYTIRVAVVPGAAAGRLGGMHDVRLFVNGQLLERRSSAGVLVDDPDDEEEREWQERTRVGKPNSANGELIEFTGVHLPHRANTRAVEIGAYAFNEHKVKSTTFSRRFDLPGDSKPRRARAVVIGFGANTFRGALQPLSYAASDAVSLPAKLETELRAIKLPDGAPLFEQVLAFTLVTAVTDSGKALDDGRKSALRAAFQQLAGRPVSKPIFSMDGVALPKLRPEDLLIVSISTHGDIDARGTFYLAASDTDTDAAKQFVPSTAVSSKELSQWFGELSTAEFVLAIDACRSAGAIQDGVFKAGPLGNRGFGQFAYDKGMRVLAASQRNQASLEAGATENGLLTFALIDRLRAGALVETKGSVSLSAWLREAERAVPDVHRRVLTGEQIRGQTVVLKILDPATLTVKRFSQGGETVELTQRPVLFDFYRPPR